MFTCGRLLGRAAGTSTIGIIGCGIRAVTIKSNFSTATKGSPTETTSTPKASSQRVDATCCGFPKDLIGGPSHVLDHGVFGEDACFISSYKSTHVAGVADGVGGWRKYGIDCSEFSSRLMKNCSEIVKSGDFEPARPDLIIAKAFKDLSHSPRPIGSSTACVVVVHQRTLYSANLGDSGFLVYRKGKIIYRSMEQVHYFNAPFQLTLLPDQCDREGFITDTPEKSDLEQIALEAGDVILLATDGLWDNVPDDVLANALASIDGPLTLQATCNSIALIARRLSHDADHASPFAVKAGQHGIRASGGKPDDITLVLIYIS